MFPAGRDNLGTVRVVVELLPLLWVVVEDAAFVAFDSIDAFTLALFLVGFVQGLV